MREITLEELLEAGCHFGHQVTRQNPKAREFIFEARDNIHIIDLAKTKEGLDEAANYIKSLAQRPDSTILFIGTKRQAQGILLEEIKRAQAEGEGIFYVTNHWIGGTFTNFTEVAKNYKKLKDISEMLKNEELKLKYTKKEIGLFEKERAKLQSFYGGIVGMKKIPDAIFAIDSHMEELAVKEAREVGVTTVGITDTNSDPYLVDYPIPANDDAVGSIKLIVNYIMDAWIEGRKDQISNLKSQSQEVKEPEVKKEEGKEEKPKKASKKVKTEEVKEPKEKKEKKAKVKKEETK